MLEKWKSADHKGKSFGTLLTDLSKAFECLSHELLLAKLHAYGFSIAALRLIHSYLTNRNQRTKVNLSYSEMGGMMLFQWFSDNQMKANISKCHLLVNKKDDATVRIGDTEIKNSEYEKLLGIKVDTKLNSNEHLNDMISKVNRKVNALSRVMLYMSLSKKKKLLSSFFNSQFNYCSLFGCSIVIL